MKVLAATSEAVLQRVYARALVRAEVSVARTRLVVLAIAAIEEVVWLALHRDQLGTLRAWVPAGVLLAGALSTVAALRAFRRKQGRPGSSAALDAALVLGVSLPAAGWPIPEYHGIFHHAPATFFLVNIAAAALRMSRPFVRLAIACNVTGMLLLLAIDAARGTPAPSPEEWILWIMSFVAVSFVADGAAMRARRLAFDGATAVLDAERSRQALGVYVSEEVAAEALAGDLAPGGRRQTVAVLFSDLRGFSRYSASIPPERLVAELNAYLAAMVDVVRENGGVVDKYIGDSIMVVFGVPRALPDAASRALRTAAGMQRALARHNAERASKGLPPLKQGIGVHYGEVVVGNIGTPERMQYTVVGDAVNVAAKLQAATRERGVDALASGVVVEVAGRAVEAEAWRADRAVPIAGHPDGVPSFALDQTAIRQGG